MSACFAYGLASGKPIAALTRPMLVSYGRALEWQNLPILIVILLGGLTTNFAWCVILMIRNGTVGQFINAKAEIINDESRPHYVAASISLNYLLCAAAGIMWYLQFFFYSIGETKMGKYDFSSWTLHMASIIIFSTLWGIYLKEWDGISRKTKILVGLGLAVLVLSTILVGYGNYLNIPMSPAG